MHVWAGGRGGRAEAVVLQYDLAEVGHHAGLVVPAVRVKAEQSVVSRDQQRLREAAGGSPGRAGAQWGKADMPLASGRETGSR